MTSCFTQKLLQWNTASNTRLMPWKNEKDPYKIWLSEIILQQTRVEQGWNYYNKFVHAYPTVHHLAQAPETAVFKLWEGLGYYSRCKNLIATARFIAADLQGVFPNTYETIQALKGIGPYTAAAIASFAYNLPYAVVDGNVFRVISRYFGVTTPVDSGEGKKLYTLLADALLDRQQAGLYNQAIMDFGAVICRPRQPLCAACVLRNECEALRHNTVHELPVKEKLLQRKVRWFYYFVITYNGFTYIRKRSAKDIWENLYEFVLCEYDCRQPFDEVPYAMQEMHKVMEEGATITYTSKEYTQQLTHQTIMGRFICITLSQPSSALAAFESVAADDLAAYPFPKFITTFLSEKSRQLTLL